MHDGKRWRMRVDEFALVRGAPEPIKSKQTAERVWEPKFLGEIMAGRDPRIAPNQPEATSVPTVAEFLDRYQTTYVEAEGPKSADRVIGHLKALKASLGSLPVAALEKPGDISRFKGNTVRAESWRRSIAHWACYARRSTGVDSRIRHCSRRRPSIVSA
jgi:hypothetical protein